MKAWGAIVFVALAVLGVLAFGGPVRAESVTVDQAKEILRLQYTQFCADVKPPPKSLVEAVQTAAQAGNTDAQIAFMWLARILERYEKNGCGNA